MIRDRGNIKWTAMMLPEHVKMLRTWGGEDGMEQRKQLDEQKLEDLNDVAAEAMEFGMEVAIVHYAGSHYEQLKGRIHYYDALEQHFRIQNQAGKVHRIQLQNIESITMVGEVTPSDG